LSEFNLKTGMTGPELLRFYASLGAAWGPESLERARQADCLMPTCNAPVISSGNK